MRMDASLLIEKYRNQTKPNLDISILVIVPNYLIFKPKISMNSARPWMYHACTELGWFSSVTSENQPFGPVVPLEYRLKFCSAVYGPE
jgi:hypothetical protein